MDEFTIKKNKSYYEQAYNAIKNMIFDGTFQNGEFICETKIAQQFNTSRSPVREAIRTLEMEGLLIKEGRKFKVYEPTKEDMQQIFECRQGLEFMAVKLATERSDHKELSEIEASLKEVESEIKKPHYKLDNNIILMNTKFHELILKHSKNIRIKNQLDNLKSLVYFYRIITLNEQDRYKEIYEQHVEIFKLMKSRNTKKASEMMFYHIQCDIDYVKMLMDN